MLTGHKHAVIEGTILVNDDDRPTLSVPEHDPQAQMKTVIETIGHIPLIDAGELREVANHTVRIVRTLELETIHRIAPKRPAFGTMEGSITRSATGVDWKVTRWKMPHHMTEDKPLTF